MKQQFTEKARVLALMEKGLTVVRLSGLPVTQPLQPALYPAAAAGNMHFPTPLPLLLLTKSTPTPPSTRKTPPLQLSLTQNRKTTSPGGKSLLEFELLPTYKRLWKRSRSALRLYHSVEKEIQHWLFPHCFLISLLANPATVLLPDNDPMH